MQSSSISHLPISHINMEKSISSKAEFNFSPSNLKAGTSSKHFFQFQGVSWQSDCESTADNFDQEMSYLWTDKRLIHLVTKFYDYVHSTDTLVFCLTSDRHKLLLHKLKLEFLTLNDGPGPSSDEIAQKLNEMAYSYTHKNSSYHDLKEILGKYLSKKFRVLARHERFDEYHESGGRSHRVSSIPAVEHSMCPGSNYYYWTDKRLQVLVNEYYMYLKKYESDSCGEGTSEKNSEKCLLYLKKRLDGNVTIPILRCRLNKIFGDYEAKSPAHEEFRTRIGKKMCTLFDSLVKLDWKLYKTKNSTPSTSRGSSSKRKSSALSKQEIARLKKELEAQRLYSELEMFGLKEEQMARLMVMLGGDEDKRTYFWACKGSVRKFYAIHLLR